MTSIKKIIISRTDSIGDVILTLPVAGVLKKANPRTEIIFLGKKYTRDVVESSLHVDFFMDWDDIQKNEKPEQIRIFKDIHADVIIHVFPVKKIAHLAKKANIPLRIGTTGRLYHYFTCNKLIPISRKRSDLHEAQLNLKLISSFSVSLPVRSFTSGYLSRISFFINSPSAFVPEINIANLSFGRISISFAKFFSPHSLALPFDLGCSTRLNFSFDISFRILSFISSIFLKP